MMLFLACEEGPGICATLLTIVSLFLIVITLPFSLFFVVKVVQVGLKDLHSDGSHLTNFRNTRERSYFDLDDFSQEGRGVQEYSL